MLIPRSHPEIGDEKVWSVAQHSVLVSEVVLKCSQVWSQCYRHRPSHLFCKGQVLNILDLQAMLCL